MPQNLITIVGPTASGKTSLGVDMAQTFEGEIVSADSRQVYKGLDLMSGKATPDERQNIPHYLIDEVPPWNRFSAAEFKTRAQSYIIDIHARGNVPFVVGGTGLYVTGLVYDYDFAGVSADQQLRERLSALSTRELRDYLFSLRPHPELTPDDTENRYRLIRYIEMAEHNTSPTISQSEPKYRTLQIGLHLSRKRLREHIATRVDHRLANGVLEEIAELYEHIARHTDRATARERIDSFGLGSRIIWSYLHAETDYETMREKFITSEYRYAKRQMTWFKKDTNIHWINAEDDPRQEARELISEFPKNG